MQDLGTLGGTNSLAFGINASGQVVGYARNADSIFHAFLYANGQMQDLNDLVDLPDGVFLSSAYGINDQGWIVGQASNGHAYLLTPIPSAVLLLGSGLLRLGIYMRRKKS
jgi:probable HAF family extracellular repeat protein